MASVFSRYAPFIQDYIYARGWQSLRAVQAAAGDVIFGSDDHLLLCASTASGKTEAAFFPILTLMAEDPPASVGALYIAPLKALINDQFDRLTELCTEQGIPVCAWHGDVSQSRKQALLKHPSGILQITPESLEALLMRRSGAARALFSDLRFVVVDEIHSLMRGDRGSQTLCLIERLSRLAGVDPRRIGLSATIGDTAAAAAFLRGSSPRRVAVPKLPAGELSWRLAMEHFFNEGAQAAEGAAPGLQVPLLEPPEGATDVPPPGADPGYGWIFAHTRGRKCLVFANSREECEALTSSLRQYCEARHEPDRFLIHHGNLSSSIRADAEEALRDDENPVSVCTTATLELGIDVGRLSRAFQVDAPYTVSGFLQRLGRTGRRGAPPEMWFAVREEQCEPRALLPLRLPWTLLQAIAVVECYREERWVEPPRTAKLPFSLLYHQTMSTLVSSGELTPAELAQRVMTLSPFARISPADYRELLLHLIKIGQIEKTERGGLIVGLNGERQVNSFRFYAVFQENEEFTVRWESRELGTTCAPPPPGEKIAIAGRVWHVDELDRDRHTVWVSPTGGKVPAFFGLVPGDIHTHILEKMRDVLVSQKSYPYLMRNAAARLAQARAASAKALLARRPLVNLGGSAWALFPWLGTYAFMALERLIRLRCAGALGLARFESAKPYFMMFTMKASEAEFYETVADEAERLGDPEALLFPNEVPGFEKYDGFVPDRLLRKGFARGVLDAGEMKARAASWRPYARLAREEPAQKLE